MTVHIKSLTLDELTALMSELGQPKFRAKQLYEWLHKHNATSYDQLTNIPKELRAQLSERYPLFDPVIINKQVSKDGTRKYLISLEDGSVVETVGIVDEDAEGNEQRLTVCCSTQAGCPMKCDFCATGQEGFVRNLSSNEIIDQLVVVERDFDARISNVVLMGQGEPFLNYDEVVAALHRMNADEGLNIGARKITVSTSGIIDRVYDFIDEPEQFRLAISLHSAIQSTRNKLMPGLTGQPLEDLHDSLLEYTARKNRRISLEYIMIDGVNDSEKELEMLLAFCDGIKCHVNLIPCNPILHKNYKPSSLSTQNHWVHTLSMNGIPVSIRYSKGVDIAGACGQLKEVHKKSQV